MAEYLTPAAVVGVALIADPGAGHGHLHLGQEHAPGHGRLFMGRAAGRRSTRSFSFGVDPWRYLDPLVSRPWALHVVEVIYLTGWMLMIGLVPAIVAFGAALRADPRPLLPHLHSLLDPDRQCARPRRHVGRAGLSSARSPATSRASSRSSITSPPTAARTTSAFDLQKALWQTYESDGRCRSAPASRPFPSMHISMATLWVIVGFAAGRIFAVAAPRLPRLHPGRLRRPRLALRHRRLCLDRPDPAHLAGRRQGPRPRPTAEGCSMPARRLVGRPFAARRERFRQTLTRPT